MNASQQTHDCVLTAIASCPQNGFGDVYISDHGGLGSSSARERALYYIYRDTDLATVTHTKMQPVGEDGLDVIYADIVDLNADGLLDSVYCLVYAPCRTVLAAPTARTDTASIDVERLLKSSLSWSGVGESATGGAGGVQVDGQIITLDPLDLPNPSDPTDPANYPFTTTYGALSDPSAHPNHQPQCHYPGGQVQPVTTHFYIEYAAPRCSRASTSR